MKYYKLTESRKLKRSQTDINLIFVDKKEEEVMSPIVLVEKDDLGEDMTEEDMEE